MGEDNQPKRLLRMSRNFLIYIQVQIYKSVEVERDKPLPRHHRLPNTKSSARNGYFFWNCWAVGSCSHRSLQGKLPLLLVILQNG